MCSYRAEKGKKAEGLAGGDQRRCAANENERYDQEACENWTAGVAVSRHEGIQAFILAVESGSCRGSAVLAVAATVDAEIGLSIEARKVVDGVNINLEQSSFYGRRRVEQLTHLLHAAGVH